MHIKELSNITGVNPETIRMYRKQGHLHPTKNEKNGYYDYSIEDYTSLSRVRKFRELGFSLEEISILENKQDLDILLDNLDNAELRLQNRIEKLEERIRYIQFERSHIISSQETLNDGNVSLDQSIDEKIDFYQPFEPENFPIFDTSKNHFFYTTTTIYVPKDILNGPVIDKVIETKVGIGTYRSIIDKINLDIGDRGIRIPNGLSISQTITMKDLEHINILDLKPMMAYAKKLNKPFISDTTGYLVNIYFENDKPVYLIRIRACIEENNIINPNRI